MNVIYFSPHFPTHYIEFVLQLKLKGATVLGIADAEYNSLPEKLKYSLTEYYKVNNMENYDEVFKAVAYFSYKYGKIDHLDSLNEYWLMTEARLRTDFNIEGLNNDSIDAMKFKSLMKQKFINAGVNVARGKVIDNYVTAKEFVEQVNYPVIAKPDNGVGALNTYKINSDAELLNFFNLNYSIPYIFEEFINGQIISFDGLTDKNGNVVFHSSATFQTGVMETVNNDTHYSYYIERQISEDLEKAGRSILKEFNLKGRFFHIEFFRTPENKLVVLEVNMRPPGGFTTEMFNYANDINIYEQWANIVVSNTFETKVERKYYVAFIGRKFKYNYAHSLDEIISYCGKNLVQHDQIAGVFSSALGNYGFIVRNESLEFINQARDFIHKI